VWLDAVKVVDVDELTVNTKFLRKVAVVVEVVDDEAEVPPTVDVSVEELVELVDVMVLLECVAVALAPVTLLVKAGLPLTVVVALAGEDVLLLSVVVVLCVDMLLPLVRVDVVEPVVAVEDEERLSEVVLLDVDNAERVVDVDELTVKTTFLRKVAVVLDVVVDVVVEGPPAIVVRVEDVVELVNVKVVLKEVGVELTVLTLLVDDSLDALLPLLVVVAVLIEDVLVDDVVAVLVKEDELLLVVEVLLLERVVAVLAVVTLLVDDSLDALLPLLVVVSVLTEDILVDDVVAVLVVEDELLSVVEVLFVDMVLPLVWVELVVPVKAVEDEE